MDPMRRWAEVRRRNRDLFFIPDPDSDIETVADQFEDFGLDWEEKFEEIDEDDWSFIESPDVPEIENRELSLKKYLELLLPDKEEAVGEGRISIRMGHVGKRRQTKMWRLRMEYRRNKSLGLKPVRRDNEVLWLDEDGEPKQRYLLLSNKEKDKNMKTGEKQ